MSRHVRELRDRALAVRLALAGRVHQYPEIQALRRFLSAFAVDCVFDVGANRGQYATMLRKDAGFDGTILSFEPNPDILAEVAKLENGPWCVGFAAETEKLAEHAEAKRARKVIPLLVGNLAHKVMDADTTELVLFDAQGTHPLPAGDKLDAARRLIAEIAARMPV